MNVTQRENDKLNPLSLPEIIYSCGPYLTRSHLTSCLRVSHVWHDSLVPFLWFDTCLFPHNSAIEPSLSKAQKHQAWIRKLSLYWGSSIDELGALLVCPNLVSLSIFQAHRDDSLLDHASQVKMIRQHQKTLKEVTLGDVTTSNVLEALADCPNLERLNCVSRLQIGQPEPWISMFERLWSRLLFVSITGLQGYPNLQPLNYLDVHIDTKDWPASKGPNRIQELVMTQHSIFSSEVHLWILRQCPDLRRLTWQVHYQFDTPMQRLAEVMESGQACRRLEELSLSKIHGFRNQQLGRILDLIEPGRLFKIDLSSTRFNRRSWEIFRNVHESAHCLSIRELSLDGCRQLLGKAVQEMLCSMPQLEIFRAESLRDTDIHEDPLPWVCLGLKELQLGFKIESTPPTRSNFFPFLPRWISVQEQRHRHEQEQQRRSLIFWSQLKRLTKLEILTRFVPQDEQSGSLVRLSLKEGGLAELKSLRQLRVVDENVTRSGEEEVEWMLENWPRLEKHCKRELDDRLKELSLNE